MDKKDQVLACVTPFWQGASVIIKDVAVVYGVAHTDDFILSAMITLVALELAGLIKTRSSAKDQNYYCLSPSGEQRRKDIFARHPDTAQQVRLLRNTLPPSGTKH